MENYCWVGQVPITAGITCTAAQEFMQTVLDFLNDSKITINALIFDHSKNWSSALNQIIISYESKRRTKPLAMASISLKAAYRQECKTGRFEEVIWNISKFGSIDASLCKLNQVDVSLLLSSLHRSCLRSCSPVSLVLDDNAINVDSCRILCEWIRQENSSLRDISLRNCGLGVYLEGSSLVCHILSAAQAAGARQGFRNLDLSQNVFTEASFARSIGAFSYLNLKRLSLESVSFSPEMATRLGSIVFARNGCLEELNLSNSKLGTEGLECLIAFSGARAGAGCSLDYVNSDVTIFKSLDVSYCGIDDFSSLSSFFALGPALQSLNVSGNRPSESSMILVCDSISKSKYLKSLNVANCAISSAAGVVLLARLASAWQLTVDSSPRTMSDAAATLFSTSLDGERLPRRSTDRITLSDACTALPPLESLDLSSNLLGFRVGNTLAKLLETVTEHPLRQLKIQNNYFGEVVMNALLASILSDRRLLHVSISREHNVDSSGDELVEAINRPLLATDVGSIPYPIEHKHAVILSLTRNAASATTPRPLALPPILIVEIFRFLRISLERKITVV